MWGASYAGPPGRADRVGFEHRRPDSVANNRIKLPWTAGLTVRICNELIVRLDIHRRTLGWQRHGRLFRRPPGISRRQEHELAHLLRVLGGVSPHTRTAHRPP